MRGAVIARLGPRAMDGEKPAWRLVRCQRHVHARLGGQLPWTELRQRRHDTDDRQRDRSARRRAGRDDANHLSPTDPVSGKNIDAAAGSRSRFRGPSRCRRPGTRVRASDQARAFRSSGGRPTCMKRSAASRRFGRFVLRWPVVAATRRVWQTGCRWPRLPMPARDSTRAASCSRAKNAARDAAVGYLATGSASRPVDSGATSITQVGRVQGEEAADQQAGAGQQHDGQRELDDHQRAGPAARPYAAGRMAAGFLEDVVHVGFGNVQRRREPEHDARPEA